MSTTERDREMVREWLWRSGILGWDESDEKSLAALVERSGREGEARALAACREIINGDRYDSVDDQMLAHDLVDEAERALRHETAWANEGVNAVKSVKP